MIIKIIDGDLDKCTWKVNYLEKTLVLSRSRLSDGFWFNEKYDIKRSIVDTECIDTENEIAQLLLKLPKTAHEGMTFEVIKDRVAFSCTLSDGRKFVAIAERAVWVRILIAVFKD